MNITDRRYRRGYDGGESKRSVPNLARYSPGPSSFLVPWLILTVSGIAIGLVAAICNDRGPNKAVSLLLSSLLVCPPAVMLQNRWQVGLYQRELVRHQTDGSVSSYAETIRRLNRQVTVALPLVTVWKAVLKRTFDLITSGLLLILLAPCIILIAICIWLVSPGPVFTHTTALGRGGAKFMLHRFRTFRVDGSQGERAGPSLTMHHHVYLSDSRLTDFGKFLHQMGLDTLPTLINVLCGEMSMVGPSALPASAFVYIENWEEPRLYIRPGLTGLWFIANDPQGSIESFQENDVRIVESKCTLDYIENFSLIIDAKVLVMKIIALLIALLTGVGYWDDYLPQKPPWEKPVLGISRPAIAFTWLIILASMAATAVVGIIGVNKIAG